VRLQSKNKYDRYKRLIAEVVLPNGVNVNKALVQNGLAWHYKKHSKSSEYAQLERVARQQRIGLWSDSNAMAPWEWRKRRR
jgi:endonuclease YncB( thermonuclease family)